MVASVKLKGVHPGNNDNNILNFVVQMESTRIRIMDTMSHASNLVLHLTTAARLGCAFVRIGAIQLLRGKDTGLTGLARRNE